MLPKSANYDTIFNSNHYAQIKVIVGEGADRITYDESSLRLLSTSCSLFGDFFDIGNIVMNEVKAKFYNVLPSAIPKFSRLEIWVRITDGTNVSNWLPKGIFYTKKPNYDTESKILEVSGYDTIFYLERVAFQNGVAFTSFNNPTHRQLANHLVSGTAYEGILETNFNGCGMELEDSNQLSNTLTLSAPPYNLTCREILSQIAIAEGGNWMLTYVNSGTGQAPLMSAKLRLSKVASIRPVASTTALVGEAISGYAIVGTEEE